MNILGGIGSEAAPVSGVDVDPTEVLASTWTVIRKASLSIPKWIVNWISWPGCTVRHIAVGRRTLCKRGLVRLDLTACALIGLDRPYCKICERVLGIKV